MLDEFQEVVEIDPDLPKLMRAVFQAQPEVAHVYLGSKRHLMRSIFNDENEPFWRSAKQLELGVIRPDLCSRRSSPSASARPASGSTTRPSRPSSRDRRPPVRDAGALLLHVGGDRPALDGDAAARARRARGRAALGARALLAHLGGRVGRAAAPAHGTRGRAGHPYSEDYRRRHRLPPATNVQKALAALARRELVGKREDGSTGSSSRSSRSGSSERSIDVADQTSSAMSAAARCRAVGLDRR